MKKLRDLQKSREEVDSHGSWAISYGDMITVLLSFFILFFPADFKEVREREMDESLVENIELLEESIPKDQIEINNLDEMMNIKQINKDNYLIFFKGISFFNSGEVDPKAAVDDIFQAFSKRINPFLGDYKVIIHAYTDNSPVPKNIRRYRDNVELSGLRSIAVKKKLELEGVDANRIEISGKGVLSPSLLKFMNVDKSDKELIKSLQRTVAFVIRRDSMKQEL